MRTSIMKFIIDVCAL